MVDGQPITLPLHCTHCLQPVRVRYRPANHDHQTERRCPYCDQPQIFTLKGTVLVVEKADDRL
jgi:NAD-dependent SIR2 family protein deacetylase